MATSRNYWHAYGRPTYEKAVAAQDFDIVTPLVGEAISLIHDVRPAADIVHEMARDAARILNRAEAPLVQG